MIRSLSRGTRGALALTGLSLAAIFAGPSGALDRSESARVPARARKAPAPAYGAFRPTFEENLGQAPADVRFLSRMAGGTVMLEPTRMTTMVEIREARPTGDPEAALLAGPRGEVGVRRHPVAMTIVGADARAACVPGATARTVTNLYLGSDPARWRSGIRNVASVRFDGVYRGIDVDYRAASRGGIEYDFHVAPGADPAAIELRLEGADSVAIDPHANLEIAAGPARIRHGAPVAYQDGPRGREPVAASFALRGDGVFGFELGAYDRSREVVIDPTTVLYSMFFGGNSTDDLSAIAVDPNGQACVAGMTSSTDAPFSVLGGSALIAQFDAAGANLNWITVLGGASWGRSIALDANADVFVAGTAGAFFPTTAGCFQAALGGMADGFVAKLNGGTGALAWATYLGGANMESANGIAIGPNGTPFVTGNTFSAGFPVTAGVFQGAKAAGFDAYVTQLNAAGNGLVYSTFLGGGGGDTGSGIIVDGNGNAYLDGETSSAAPAAFPTTIGTVRNLVGVVDLFVTCLNAAGNGLVWSTYLGGTQGDYTYTGIGLDSNLRVYVGGTTYSTDYPTASAFQGTFGGGNCDGFMTRITLNGQGQPRWGYSTFLGGTGDDVVNCVTASAGGNAYVTGWTGSTDFPAGVGAYQTSNAGASDGFVVDWTSSLSVVSASYLGGTSSDSGEGIAVDGNGDMYVSGSTFSSDYPVTTGSFQGTIGSGTPDGFVTKLQ